MRLTKLRAVLPEQEIDAILVGQPQNRRYLSGFTGSAGWLVITAEQTLIATDSRYYEQVGREAPEFKLVKITGRVSDLLSQVLADLGIKRLGFESQHLTVEQLNTFSKATSGVEWLPFKDTVEKIRAIKDQDEIDALCR